MSRTLIAVVGCHRSGTSATAGTLAALGLDMGPDLMPASPANPRGYWESTHVVRTHERLLRHLGLTWDTETLPEHSRRSWPMATARNRLLYILERQCQGELFALKDPRMCLFPELWLEAAKLADVRVVPLYVSRNSPAIGASLQHRDAFTREHARAVVRTYMAGMRRWVELAGLGCGVTYEDLLADWRTALGREFLDQLEVSTEQAAAVESFLDRGLDHHG